MELLDDDVELPYPYVLARVYPAVYWEYPVEFVADGESGVRDVVTVGRATLDEAARTELIALAQALARELFVKLCVVFGARDGIYIGEDGDVFPSDTPPWGGLRIGPHRKQRDDYAVAEASRPLPDVVAPEQVGRAIERRRGDRLDSA